MNLLGPDGVLVSYGRSSGEPGPIDPWWFGEHSGARMEGLLVFTEVEARRLGTRQLDRLLALVASGVLDPQIALEGSWLEPMPLVDALLAREVPGKAVLLVD
jgi:NADPH:quinone reductase-like Zn-dependent oxidoreductase